SPHRARREARAQAAQRVRTRAHRRDGPQGLAAAVRVPRAPGPRAQPRSAVRRAVVSVETGERLPALPYHLVLTAGKSGWWRYAPGLAGLLGGLLVVAPALLPPPVP